MHKLEITFTHSGLHCSARLMWSFSLFFGHPVYIHKFKLWNTVIFFFPEIPGIYIHIQYVYIILYKFKLRWNSCSCYTYTYCIYIFKTLCMQYVYILRHRCKLRWNFCSRYTYTYYIYICKYIYQGFLKIKKWLGTYSHFDQGPNGWYYFAGVYTRSCS